MEDCQHSEHRGPVQTSNVLVLGASKLDLLRPPSPPTPSLSPPDSVCEHIEPLDLPEHDTSEHVLSLDREPMDTRLHNGLHVMNTQANAVRTLTMVYESDACARDGFSRSVDAITRNRSLGAKLVLTGVGKSGHIGRKMVATFQSLGLPAVFLHPTEALHGDLGIVGPHDTFIFITFSGKTPELLRLLDHLPDSHPMIVLTSHTRRGACELLRTRNSGILLPAPIPESEMVSFGVAAPTTSTTAALVVGDALAITSANELYPSVSSVFARNHPGGAIGAAFKQQPRQTIAKISTLWADIPSLSHDVFCIDLLRTGFGTGVGWVHVGEGVASPSRIRRLSSAELCRPALDIPDLVIERQDMVEMVSQTSIEEAKIILQAIGDTPEGAFPLHPVVAVVDDDGGLVGVLEACQILSTREV